MYKSSYKVPVILVRF